MPRPGQLSKGRWPAERIEGTRAVGPNKTNPEPFARRPDREHTQTPTTPATTRRVQATTAAMVVEGVMHPQETR